MIPKSHFPIPQNHKSPQDQHVIINRTVSNNRGCAAARWDEGGILIWYQHDYKPSLIPSNANDGPFNRIRCYLNRIHGQIQH